MGHELNFAPISSQPSTRLRLVMGYLRLNGWFGLGALAVGAVGAIAGYAPLRAVVGGHILAMLVTAVGCGSLLLAAGDLAAGRRRGAYAAGTIFALSILAALLGQGVSFEGLLVGVLGLGAVVSAWGELE